MDPVYDYNYPAFSFAFDEVGAAQWLREGPQAGSPAPEFRLETLEGDTVSLSDMRGKPVVLEFGSYTCPIFCGHVEAMERVAGRHPEASFLVLYTREAHPGEITREHRTLEHKRAAARRLVDEEDMRRTVLIDNLEGSVHRAYGAAWDAVYVIDAQGNVVLRQQWTHPGDVESVLDDLAAGKTVAPSETTDMAPPVTGRWARISCAEASKPFSTSTEPHHLQYRSGYSSRHRRRSGPRCHSSLVTDRP